MLPEDYPRLPWWKQRLAEEGLVREFGASDTAPDVEVLTLESFGVAWS